MQNVRLDPAVIARVNASFNAQGFMRTLGASLLALRPGEAEILLPFSSNIAQQHGFVHAGALTTILDNACGFAAMTLMPQEMEVLTIEFKTNFLRPAVGGAFHANARVKKAGRQVSVVEAEIVAVTNGDAPPGARDQNAVFDSQKPIALMLATMMAVPTAVLMGG